MRKIIGWSSNRLKFAVFLAVSVGFIGVARSDEPSVAVAPSIDDGVALAPRPVPALPAPAPSMFAPQSFVSTILPPVEVVQPAPAPVAPSANSLAPILSNQAESTTPARHEWERYINRARDPNAELPLPPADRLQRELASFLQYAREQFETAYKGNVKDFLAAVRGGNIYRAGEQDQFDESHAKPAELQANGIERNGLSDQTKARWEMILIEEKKTEVDANGKKQTRVIKRVAVKYAPREVTKEMKDHEVRVIFYNVDHPVNQGERINIEGRGPDVYHARIGVNTHRNALVLSMTGDQVEEGIYHHRPSIRRDGFKEAWRLYWKAKYEPITWRNVATGAVSATAQGVFSYYAFKWFGNTEHAMNYVPAAITWTNVFFLSTFSKTYANIIRSKNPNREILLRTLTGLPQSVLLGIANHANWLALATYTKVVTIPLGDKVASTVFSFIPMIRNERGVTSGKKFLWESRAVAEREGVSWLRQIVQQFAIANDTNPNATFRHLGNLLVWASAIPVGFIDLWYAKANSKKYPKMLEDAERLKKWANPKTHFAGLVQSTKKVCYRVFEAVSRRTNPGLTPATVGAK